MSYRRGSFHTGAPRKGSFNRSSLQKLHEGFVGLFNAVTDAANKSANRVLASQTAYKFSFDEGQHVPVTSPTTGTIMLTGISDPVAADQLLTQLGNKALADMQDSLAQQLKEKGYD